MTERDGAESFESFVRRDGESGIVGVIREQHVKFDFNNYLVRREITPMDQVGVVGEMGVFDAYGNYIPDDTPIDLDKTDHTKADMENINDLARIHLFQDKLKARSALVEAAQASTVILEKAVQELEDEVQELDNPTLPFGAMLHQVAASALRKDAIKADIRKIKAQMSVDRSICATYAESMSLLITNLDMLYAKPYVEETS